MKSIFKTILPFDYNTAMQHERSPAAIPLQGRNGRSERDTQLVEVESESLCIDDSCWGLCLSLRLLLSSPRYHHKRARLSRAEWLNTIAESRTASGPAAHWPHRQSHHCLSVRCAAAATVHKTLLYRLGQYKASTLANNASQLCHWQCALDPLTSLAWLQIEVQLRTRLANVDVLDYKLVGTCRELLEEHSIHLPPSACAQIRCLDCDQT